MANALQYFVLIFCLSNINGYHIDQKFPSKKEHDPIRHPQKIHWVESLKNIIPKRFDEIFEKESDKEEFFLPRHRHKHNVVQNGVEVKTPNEEYSEESIDDNIERDEEGYFLNDSNKKIYIKNDKEPTDVTTRINDLKENKNDTRIIKSDQDTSIFNILDHSTTVSDDDTAKLLSTLSPYQTSSKNSNSTEIGESFNISSDFRKSININEEVDFIETNYSESIDSLPMSENLVSSKEGLLEPVKLHNSHTNIRSRIIEKSSNLKSINNNESHSRNRNNLSWLGLFFTHYRNDFWMTMNSLLLIAIILSGGFSLYRLIWLPWCSSLINRTFYLVVHLLIFTGAAFLTVQLLHLLLGSNEGLPLILTLTLVHTPVSCLIVTLWFIIYCVLSSARLHLFGDYLPTPDHLAIAATSLIIGSFICDLIIGISHSIWFLLLSRVLLSLMAMFPEFAYILKMSKLRQVVKLLNREYHGELKLLVTPTANGNENNQSDAKHLLRERLQIWSNLTFYCSIISIVMLMCTLVLSIFFTIPHIPIILWWCFHILSSTCYITFIIAIILTTACTLQSELKERKFIDLFKIPKTIKPNNTVQRRPEQIEPDQTIHQHQIVPNNTSSPLNEEGQHLYLKNNSNFNPPRELLIRPRPTLRRSATFNCDSQNRMYRMPNHAVPSYVNRPSEMPQRGNSTMLIHEEGFVRFRTPMEYFNPNIAITHNISNNFNNINIYQSQSETGYGTLKYSHKPRFLIENSGYTTDIPPQQGVQKDFINSNAQPQYRLQCQTKYIYSPLHVIRPSLYRNSSFTVPQSALNRGQIPVNSPYLMKSHVYESRIPEPTPHSYKNEVHSSNLSMSTFKPNLSSPEEINESTATTNNITSQNTLSNTSSPQMSPRSLSSPDQSINIRSRSGTPIHNVSQKSQDSIIHNSSKACNSPELIHRLTSSNQGSPYSNRSLGSKASNGSPIYKVPVRSLPPTPEIEGDFKVQVNGDSPVRHELYKYQKQQEYSGISTDTTVNIRSPNIRHSDKANFKDETVNTNIAALNRNKDIEKAKLKNSNNNANELNDVSSLSDNSLAASSRTLTELSGDGSNTDMKIDTFDNGIRRDFQEIDIEENCTRIITDKAPSLKRNHSTAGCSSEYRKSSFHGETEATGDRIPSNNEKYPWYGTWGGRKKSRKTVQHLADQFQNSLLSLQNQPKILSSSRASLVGLYSKLKQNKAKKIKARRRREEKRNIERNGASGLTQEFENDTEGTESDTTVSNSKEVSEDEDSDSIDSKSIDWALELIKSSELLSGFYSIEIQEKKEQAQSASCENHEDRNSTDKEIHS